ncbi:hypothetical protein DRE_00897 [Drechslerella stenobrocha 248]|uniref:MARVEL domain-containing protein n=1 Tax=Drechslerella stenobrocha 248 TaxID=1043628 RepID=W7I014_9PEZI|nr:hypothetical protein DRE_00897 [Drechslerella stenobrocha 248]
MDPSRPTAYEPYRHAGLDENGTEKLLVPSNPQHRGLSPKHAKGWGNRGSTALERIRTALRALVLALAITTVAIQAHGASVYFNTRDDEAESGGQTQWRIMAWAVLNLRPTWTVLAVAACTVPVQAIALISLCTWLDRIRYGMWHIGSVYCSSAVSIAAWIGALVYFRVANSQGTARSNWDIWSYTCYNKSRIGSVPWAALCIEMEYTFIAAVTVVAAEILGLVLFVITQQQVGKYREVSYKASWRR